MDERWRAVETALSTETQLVGRGPGILAAHIETNLEAADDPTLLMQLDLHFDGTRVVLRQLLLGSVIEPRRSISPADVARLRVAEAVHTACVHAATEMARSDTWKSALTGVDLAPRRDRRASEDELRLVAAVYAFEHAAWGSPRNAVMQTWGLPRSTANGWIRRAAELVGGLPGVGSDRGQR